jgi:hypothetical protein
VSVLVIDCTTIGAAPPTTTEPTLTGMLLRRAAGPIETSPVLDAEFKLLCTPTTRRGRSQGSDLRRRPNLVLQHRENSGQWHASHARRR